MASGIGSAWRSFWHTMTSYDRHASHNSPYRTGQHQKIPQSRHDPLTSVTTTAADSSVNLTSTSNSEAPDPATASSASFNGQSPNAPYTPGMKSALQRQQSEEGTSLSRTTTAEIQMQSFSDGLPPPPPVGHSWKRIDRWAEDHYEELFDNLCEGCTQNDINELEHELDCTLPQEVRDSLQVHDGQERGGLPTGILFGCMLLDCEEIVQEWKNWRTVNDDILAPQVTYQTPQLPLKAFAGASSSFMPPPVAEPVQKDSKWREDLLARQDSQPSNAIKKAYAHTAWVPLARDWGGNNLAIDLAPGPTGKWGQVILMGRDYDCKYVVARSWAAFLATVADDLSTNKVFVHEETGELKLREFKKQNVEPGYFDILRWRSDQKYGRKLPLRRKSAPNGDVKVNSNIGPVVGRGSPYSSPISSDAERSASPQRFPGKGLAASSPRMGQLSSPLARVAEETSTPVKQNIESGLNRNALSKSVQEDLSRPSEDIMTSIRSEQSHKAVVGTALKENSRYASDTNMEANHDKNASFVNGAVNDVDEMKTVAI